MNSWKENQITIIDTETTGTDPTTARVWEIGLAFLGGPLHGRTSQVFVNPGVPIPDEVIEMCGLSKQILDQIYAAPLFDQILERLEARVGGQILAGWNILLYDWPLLQAEACRCQYELWPPDMILDPLYYARRNWPQLRNRRLATVAEHLGVPNPGAHRAVADCQMVFGILQAILPYLDEDMRKVHDLQQQWMVAHLEDFSRYGHWLARGGESGELLVACGKSSGKSVTEVDAGFCQWVLGLPDVPDGAREVFHRRLQELESEKRSPPEGWPVFAPPQPAVAPQAAPSPPLALVSSPAATEPVGWQDAPGQEVLPVVIDRDGAVASNTDRGPPDFICTRSDPPRAAKAEPPPRSRRTRPKPEDEELPEDVQDFITDCTNLIARCEDLPERAEDFANSVATKCEEMREWAEENRHVTEKMQDALDNMAGGVARWER
jgi:DNA polymerase III epsilon subunit-like protein